MPRSSPPSSTHSRFLVLVGLLLLPLLAHAQEAPSPDRTKQDWLQKAKEAEKRSAWLDACRCYEEAIRKDRDNVAARDGYLRCLRRLHLVSRHHDAVYRKTLSRLKPNEALTTYEQVLQALAYAYPDRTRTDLTLLFNQGLQEVQLALADPVFRRHYLAGVKPAVLDEFQSRLADWPVPKMTRTSEARKQVWELINQAGKDGLPTTGTFANAFVLEFAAGACNSLDESSNFLTPGHLADLLSPGAGFGAGREKSAGVGMELGISDDRLRITRTYPDSPAREANLKPGDRILRVGGQSVEGMPAEAVAEKLRGDAGSTVAVDYERLSKDKDEVMRDTIVLKRRAVILPGLEYERRLHENIPFAYLRINYFTEETLREVKEALAGMLQSGPIKGMILDLRGNPGGVFTAAVNVAELFLSGGVISIAQSALPEFNGAYKSERPGELQFPVVVLIDGETASAAEVLAAALKESRSARTVLMGQTTFGKGSIQCLIQLKKAPLDKMAGIRLTVAKLLTPSSTPITGKGVAPDKPLAADANAEEAAGTYLLDLIKQVEMMMGAALAKNMN